MGAARARKRASACRVAGRCRRCCARCRRCSTWGGSSERAALEEAHDARPRGPAPGGAAVAASRGSASRGLPATPRIAPTPRVSPSAGARALKSSRCRMSRGSGSARSSSRAPRRSCSQRHVGAPRRRARPAGAQPRTAGRGACRSRSPPTPRPSATCCSTRSRPARGSRPGVPVCVVLDDLHWADAQSLALLQARAAHGRAGRAAGDRDLPRLGPRQGPSADRVCSPTCARSQGVQRIALHGLGADEVARDHERRRRATSSTRTGSSWPDRSRRRPTATRSSWGRSCAACRSPARWSSTRPALAGASIAPRGSRCRRACAR